MHICAKILNIDFFDNSLRNMAQSGKDIDQKAKHYEWKVKVLASDFIHTFFIFSSRNVKENSNNWKTQ